MSDPQSEERERAAAVRLPALEKDVYQLKQRLERAESDRGLYAHLALKLTREAAYQLVEADLKIRKVTKLFIGEYVITAERSCKDGTVERCPCPTLLMAVEGLGGADGVIVLSEKPAADAL